MDTIYKGYKVIEGNTEFINEYLSNVENNEWYVNEYAIIKNIDDGSEKEMRWDGEKFVSLKLPPQKWIKGKNALQRCALDMLINPNITICLIPGVPGGGKSHQSVVSGLYCIREKGYYSNLTIIREPISSGRTSGYLPGALDDKIGLYFKPIEDQLNGGEFELHQLRQRGELDVITPHYIKGRTLNSSYIIVEEAEDLTDKQARLIGTRVGVGSKIIFSGDYKQSEIDTSENNILLKMCHYFKGNPMCGICFLEDDVRSETSKLFANMYFD